MIHKHSVERLRERIFFFFLRWIYFNSTLFLKIRLVYRSRQVLPFFQVSKNSTNSVEARSLLCPIAYVSNATYTPGAFLHTLFFMSGFGH